MVQGQILRGTFPAPPPPFLAPLSIFDMVPLLLYNKYAYIWLSDAWKYHVSKFQVFHRLLLPPPIGFVQLMLIVAGLALMELAPPSNCEIMALPLVQEVVTFNCRFPTKILHMYLQIKKASDFIERVMIYSAYCDMAVLMELWHLLAETS